MKLITDYFTSKDFLFIVGILCLGLAAYFTWNMYRTRTLQRSTYFWKAEFFLIGILILTFVKDTAIFIDIQIKWLFVALELGYTPGIQLMIVFVVICLNLHINSKWKSNKII